MLARTCFTRDELEHYLRGLADDALCGAIEGHLESCPRCEDTLSELDAGDDTLIRTLQVKGGDAATETPAWVARLANMPDMPRDMLGTMSRADDAEAAEPPVELGDYELVGVLGRGGMSVVFAARHKHLGREVALKILLPTTQHHAVSRDRFAREMRAVGGLDHAAIIRATDAGQCNETLYLVMERIDGVDLNRVSKSEGPLRVADACAIGVAVARGLAHAHEQGVVHRDIKPSNVMLDRGGNVKILDFGLARMQSTACDVSLQTTMGQLLGTLDYMAPEQASGCNVDARADIYALGATLFKLLTGVPPHGRSAEMPIIEFLNHLATHDARRLDSQRDQLPGELVELVSGMLHRDPERRIASAAEVAERLEGFAAGANLRELSASAAAKTAAAPESPTASVKTSLREVWGAPLAADQASVASRAQAPEKPPVPPAVAHGARFGGVVWGAMAVVGLSVIGWIALTIVLTLKSPEGEIRIESELDNIKVELVDEKDRVDLIAVEQGAAITTVRAGRYRIRLDSSADGIEVTPHEVFVTKGKVVIAKVKKTPTSATPADDPAAPQRDPVVMMEAQVQLAETMDKLAEAKKQPQPDAEAIKSLEEKLGRLRALSRPIPTEPVYEGRTLADWVAQMKYEQESTAREIAASRVLKLAVTRPDEERMELFLDAGSRLLKWDYADPVEKRLYLEVLHGDEVLGGSALRISQVDRQVAVAHLVHALRSEERHRREYALVLCAELRGQIQQGEWPGLVEALEACSRAASGGEQVVSQLVYAICLADARQAASVMAAIDLDQASERMVPTIIYAARDRKLEIPRAQEIAWVAAYFEKLPFFDERRSRVPDDLEALWLAPTHGPFRGIDWDHVDDALQADVNAAVAPFLETFGQRLARVAKDPLDEQRQLEAAVESNALRVLVGAANLTGETQQQAVELLDRRLAQLLQIRAMRKEEIFDDVDSPAGVAVTILLLTGEAPASIKETHMQETGRMAEYLNGARLVLTPINGVVSVRGTAGGMGQRGNTPLADWYPYELLTLFHEALVKAQAGEPDPSPFGRFGAFQRKTSLSQLISSSSSWKLDPRLILDFARTSASAAEFINDGISYVRDGASSRFSGDSLNFGGNSRDFFTPRLLRHPAFEQAVVKFMKGATSRAATEVGYKFWLPSQSQPDVDGLLLGWLKSGDVVHARFALEVAEATFAERFRGEWAELAAAAIDRIAAQVPLDLQELTYLEALGDKAPQAASHALKYLAFWLENPAERRRQKEKARTTGSRRGGFDQTLLQPCLNILRNEPEQAAQAKTMIAEALSDLKTFSAADDRSILTFLESNLPAKAQ